MTSRRRRGPVRRRRDHADAGSVAVMTTGIVVLLLVLGSVVLALGELAAKIAAASSAADMAALAGAANSIHGADAACAAANRSARRNGVVVARCDVDGDDVNVTVRARAPAIISRAAGLAGRSVPPLTVRARAGPASCDDLTPAPPVCESWPIS